jgi:circadian clock protein KaiB
VSTYRFTLFVAGRSPRSVRAIENLEDLGRRQLEGDYELIVVDVVEDPAVAEEQQIMATPTVIKAAPAPVRRVTGDLSDPRAVAIALGL